MKKIVTLPSGEKQEIEGTPEEIAAYESRLKKEGGVVEYYPPGASTPRRILNENEQKLATDDVQMCPCKGCVDLRRLIDSLKTIPQINPTFPNPIWVGEPCQHDFPSPWLGTIPPTCRKCGQSALMLSPSFTLTVDSCDPEKWTSTKNTMSFDTSIITLCHN